MRLVPNYLIIGSGRMAKHFSYYLTLLNLPFQQWSRKNNSAKKLFEYSNACSHVLLLMSDSVIENFIHQHSFLLTKCCVHFSGSLVAENIFSTHPLMTFGHDLYTLNTYRNIPFVLEKEGPDLNNLLPGLPNQSFKIARNLKPLYHALIAMGNNFMTLLWQHIFLSLENDLHLPQEVAHPILRQTVNNLLVCPNNALTGPLVRNDKSTIQVHLEALRDGPFEEIYQSFVDLFQKSQVRN